MARRYRPGSKPARLNKRYRRGGAVKKPRNYISNNRRGFKPGTGGPPLTEPCPPGMYECPWDYCTPDGIMGGCVNNPSDCSYCGDTGGGDECPAWMFECWDRSCVSAINDCPPNPNFDPGSGEITPGYLPDPGTGDWDSMHGGNIGINYYLHGNANLVSFPFNMTDAQSAITNVVNAWTSHSWPAGVNIVSITGPAEAAVNNPDLVI